MPSGGSIIDIGRGSGRDVKNVSDKGFRVTGIDFSPSMIEIAKRNAPKAIFKTVDIHSLNLEDIFDAAWADASLLHIPKEFIDEAGHLVHEIQTGPFARKIVQTLVEIVLTMTKMDCYMIIDDVLFGKWSGRHLERCFEGL
ncbi:MAG: class I SAM-dependent methyltransferase [Parachlamydiaceae bacterium]